MYPYFKPLMDRVLAAIGLVLLSPVMALVAWRIYKEDRGPVLFKHERVGLNGRLFGCYKFRSMRQDAPTTLARWKAENSPEWQEFQLTSKLVNDPRVMKVGHFLRKTSLDELPQLLNVLKGEMSLVGPRPVTEDELCHYEEHEGLTAYLRTVPGVTGLWQVSGRSDTTYRERVLLDRQYAARITFRQDAQILVRTLAVPFSQRGAY